MKKKKKKRCFKQTIEIDGNKIKVLDGKTNVVYTDKEKGITVISAGGDVILGRE